MYRISVVKAQGGEAKTIKVAGENLNFAPGDFLDVATSSEYITSLIKEGSTLHLILGNSFDLHVNNFFDLPSPRIQFEDILMSGDEIKSLLKLHLNVIHSDKSERYIEAMPGSRLQVYPGDQFEFLNSEVTHDDLHRRINDLRVNYHLEDGGDKNYIDLAGFFDSRAAMDNPPIVLLNDENRRTTDMFVQPTKQHFQMHGAPTTIAIAGVFYAFYFTIKNYDPESAEVEVIFDGAPLPSWLSLNYLGAGKFVLSGVPPMTYEGTANIEINVHGKDAEVNIHTQQAYQLVISSKPELTERAAVGGVLEAEVRGAVATQSSESFMASSQASASSAAPLALIAAVSSLSVFGKTYGQDVEQVSFSAADVDALLKEDFGITFTTFVLTTGDTQLTLSTASTEYYGGGDLSEDARDFDERERVRDEREDRDVGQDVIATAAPIGPVEPTPTILYDETTATNPNGEFSPQPDNLVVPESGVFTLEAPGLLENDKNLQTEKFEVFSFRGSALNIGKEIELESGAIVTVFNNGKIIYDPNGAWEFLAEGQTPENPDTFSYVNNNFFKQASSTVTFIVVGENDAPVIENQTFSIEENSTSFSMQEFIQASDVDQGDVLTYMLLPGTETPLGSTAFLVNAVDGEITVADVLQLDFETTPSFTFVVQVSDILLATDNATITINLIDVNEAPEIEDQAFSIDENEPNGTFVSVADAFDQDAGDSLTFTITEPNFDAFRISSGGVIRVDDVNQLDFETTPTFTFEVTVEDEDGLTDTADITINLNDVNEAPVVNNQTFDIDENSINTTVVGTVAASDPDIADVGNLTYSISSPNNFDAFAINTMTGEITVNDTAQLDFEETESFSFTVRVEDLEGLFDTATITVDINDVNEAPVIDNQTFDVNESTPSGTANGQVVGTLTVDDPDAGDTLTYSILTPMVTAFSINSNGEIVVADFTQLDYETTTQFVFDVQVEDSGNLTDTATITIDINDVNEAPVITDNQMFSLAENETNGFEVGTVLASDPDAGAMLTYDILTNGTPFSIDDNGLITLANSGQLDFESTQQYLLTVEVDDGTNTDTAIVTIDVNNVTDVVPFVDLNGGGGTNYSDTWTGSAINIADVSGTSQATVTDVENDITSMTVTITNLLDGTDESLSYTSFGGITGSYDDTTGVLSLTGSTTTDNWESVLKSITYDNASATPDTTARSIEVEVSDGTFTSTTRTSTIDLNPPALTAEGGENMSDVTAPSLSYEDLNSAINTAYNDWASLGLSDDQLALINNTTFVIDDLSGGQLGLELDDMIVIDYNAANYGWSYEEGGLYGDMDLLTVINHEIGHLLDLEHTEDGLMSDTLAAGESYDLDADLLDYDLLAHDDGSLSTDDGSNLDDMSSDELLSSDDLSFDTSSSTQTVYADDLLPNMADSLQSDGDSSGGGSLLGYDSLTVDHQESVI